MANEVHDLRLGWTLREAVKNALPPVMTNRPAPCQEMIYRAEDPDFDLRKLVPYGNKS